MTHEESSKNLTRLEKKFCIEYVLDFKGTDAYIRASDKPNRNSASVQACKMLKKDKVKNYIQMYIQETLGPYEKHLKENVEFWIQVRDGALPGEGKGQMVPIAELQDLLTPEELKDLTKYTVNPTRLVDRMRSSEYLAKYQQMFVEKKEVSIEGAIQIVDDIG